MSKSLKKCGHLSLTGFVLDVCIQLRSLSGRRGESSVEVVHSCHPRDKGKAAPPCPVGLTHSYLHGLSSQTSLHPKEHRSTQPPPPNVPLLPSLKSEHHPCLPPSSSSSPAVMGCEVLSDEKASETHTSLLSSLLCLAQGHAGSFQNTAFLQIPSFKQSNPNPVHTLPPGYPPRKYPSILSPGALEAFQSFPEPSHL